MPQEKQMTIDQLDPTSFEVESTPTPQKPAAVGVISSVDPKSYEIEHVPDTDGPKENAAMSAIAGIEQALTFNYGDEIIGALRAGIGSLSGEGKFSDLYPHYRDQQREFYNLAKASNPKTYKTAEFAGAAAMMIPTLSPVGAAGKGLAGLVKTATPQVGEGFIKGAAKMGLGGALLGSGASEESPVESPEKLGKFASDTAKGAAVGAGAGILGTAVGKLAGLAGTSAMRSYAERKAVRAAGAMKKEITEMAEKGILNQVGRELLDKKIVTAFGSADELLAKIEKEKGAAGEAIGKIIDGVDDINKTAIKMIDEGKLYPGLPERGKAALKYIVNQNTQISLGKIASRIRSEIINDGGFRNPFAYAENKKLLKLVDVLENVSYRRPTASMQTSGRWKKFLGDKTNWSSESIPQQYMKQVYGIFSEEMEKAVSSAAKLEEFMSSNGKTLLQSEEKIASDFASKVSPKAYEATKKSYRNLATALEMAYNKMGREVKNREISLTDYITGAAAFMHGGAPAGIGATALNKFMRKYGDSVQAVTADKIANAFERAPQLFAPFSGALRKAANEGSTSLLLTHYALMDDPEYRSIFIQPEPSYQKKGLTLPNNKGGK